MKTVSVPWGMWYDDTFEMSFPDGWEVSVAHMRGGPDIGGAAIGGDGIRAAFVQDNISHSAQGVLRGLHYQKHPGAQGKLVMALKGRVFDVAVDIRRGSATYGKWVGPAKEVYVPSSSGNR